MKNNVRFDFRMAVAKTQRGPLFGATILAFSMACGLNAAQAEGLSLGGISDGAGLGGGTSAGVDAGVDVGIGSGSRSGSGAGTGVGAGVGVGADVGTSTGTGVGAAVGVRTHTVNGAGPIVTTHRPAPSTTPSHSTPPIAVLGPKSVLGVDTTVLGIDVVAAALEYNGNLLDVCIGSCRETAIGGGTGGGGTGGTGGGTGTDGGVLSSAVSTTGTATALPALNVGLGSGDPCGEAASAARITKAAMSTGPQNGNPGRNFDILTADLNLPMRGVELRCSAGGNAQVFNGYSVVDMNGQKIGVVHDAFLTETLQIRRIQFQGVDQRCFGLSNGAYKAKGNSLIVDVPASFVYQ